MSCFDIQHLWGKCLHYLTNVNKALKLGDYSCSNDSKSFEISKILLIFGKLYLVSCPIRSYANCNSQIVKTWYIRPTFNKCLLNFEIWRSYFAQAQPNFWQSIFVDQILTICIKKLI